MPVVSAIWSIRLEVAPATWNSSRSPLSAGRPSVRARGRQGDAAEAGRGRWERRRVERVAVRLGRAPHHPPGGDRDAVGAGRRDRDGVRRVARRAHLDDVGADPGELPAAHRGVRAGSDVARAGPCHVAGAAGLLVGDQPRVGAGIGAGGGEHGGSGLGGRGPQRGRAGGQGDGVADPQRPQDARLLGHRGVGVRAALRAGQRREDDDRQRAADAEAEADEQPQRRVAERDADAGQRPHGEREDEGGEAEPEQHAVQPGRERHRQHPPPRLGHLPADLGHDARAARLARRRGQRDQRRDRHRPGAQRVPEEREAAERDDSADQRAGGERRRRRRASSAAARRSRAAPACRPSRSRTATTRR